MEEKVINLEGITPENIEAEAAESVKAEDVQPEAVQEAPAEAPEEAGSAEAEASAPETPTDEETAEIAPETAENEAVADAPESEQAEGEKPVETAENAPENDAEEAPADEPEAPVVPADAGEIEREEKAEAEKEKHPDKSAKPKAKETSIRGASRRKAAPKVREIDEVGTKSNEIEAEEALIKSDKEIADDVYRALVRAKRNGEYLMGEVYAVEPESDVFKNHAVIDVLYNGVKVMIPDTVYFEDDYDFGSTYDSLPERKKTARRAVAARFQTGAKVYFTVSAISREEITLPNGEKHTVVFAVGDRKDAMRKVRDTYFLHRNRVSETRAPRNVEVGDLAKAHVLSVREDMALVECLGVETRVDAFNLSNQIIENCQDFTKPGDTLKVRIKKLHVDLNDADPSKDRVYLTVSGRLNDATEALVTMKPRTYVAGIVSFYNRDKSLYTIMLKNGVTAVVRAEDVRGQIDLNPGDRVNVFIKAVLPTHVLGIAAKA